MVNIVRNLIDHGKQSAADVIKNTSKRAIQKTAEVTCDLIGNKIADKITGVSKTSPKNNSETNEEETLRKKIYITRTKSKSYWWRKNKENYWWSKIKERILNEKN